MSRFVTLSDAQMLRLHGLGDKAVGVSSYDVFGNKYQMPSEGFTGTSHGPQKTEEMKFTGGMNIAELKEEQRKLKKRYDSGKLTREQYERDLESLQEQIRVREDELAKRQKKVLDEEE